MKMVRYVGIRNPVQTDPAGVRELLAAGAITKADLWAFNEKRFGAPMVGHRFGPVTAAVPGVTARALGPAEGMSRRYVWGPDALSFVQPVTDEDWDAIQQLAEASHFEVVEEAPVPGRARKQAPASPATEE